MGQLRNFYCHSPTLGGMNRQTIFPTPKSTWFYEVWAQRQLVDWTAVAAFLLPFLLYLLTLSPTIYNLDSAELTTAVATNGLIRATGYPLYLLLGKLWSFLPVGDMGYRMNLFSAVCGALTIFLADQILRRLRVGGWARLGALGLLATAPYFWAMSLIAEVYTLHTALMAGVILALLWWREEPTVARLILPIFLMSLSLGNHAATFLLIPGCVWYVLVSYPKLLLKPRVWLLVLVAVALGASIFLLLPLRYAANPVFNYAGTYDATGTFHPVNLQTWSGFSWLVMGKAFAGQMFGYEGTAVWGELMAYTRQLWRAFLLVGIGPGLLGAAVLWRRNWRLAGLLTLMFLANAVFFINYRVVDKTTMFLPTYLIWALWLGIGYQVLLDWLGEIGQSPIANLQSPISILRVSMLLVVITAVLLNWNHVDRSNEWSTRWQSEDIFVRVEANALIFGWWDVAPGLQYLQLVEGQRPDVTIINRFLISGEDMNQLIMAELGKRPIYINNPSVQLLQHASVRRVGSLYLLEPRGESVNSEQ
jgi:hypothetical protein